MAHPTLLALLGYIGWTLALLVAIVAQRTVLTLSGVRIANSFLPDGSEGSALAARLCRAHANCIETFPLFAGLLLIALITDQTALTDGTALWALGARLGQSVTHIASTRVCAVHVRFTFFAVQLGLLALWASRLIAAAI